MSSRQDVDHDDDAVERVKRGLQRVLVTWFPVAGRLRINEGSGKLEIDCNNEGVLLIMAETFSKLEELGKLHEYKTCYEKLVPQLPQNPENISDNPLVAVQVLFNNCVYIYTIHTYIYTKYMICKLIIYFSVLFI